MIGRVTWTCTQLRSSSSYWLWHPISDQRYSQCNFEIPTRRRTFQLHTVSIHGKVMRMCIQASNRYIHQRQQQTLCLRYMMCMTSRARFRIYFLMQASKTLQDKLSIAPAFCK
jgi:hypothetical protein